MSNKDKLIARLKRRPKDFTFSEAETLLGFFSYVRINKGKTSRSRVVFVNLKSGTKISMHNPHPQKVLKEYQMKQILSFLEKEGLI